MACNDSGSTRSTRHWRRRLPGTERASFPFWSPDSRSLGFFVPGKLKRIDASGGPVQELCDAAVGRGGTWNQDGVIVFSPAPSAALMRVSDRGGASTALAGFLAESNAHLSGVSAGRPAFPLNLGASW